MIRRWLRETAGQDLIEYALLATFIGLVGIAAWSGIQAGIGTAYNSWDAGVQQKACNPNPLNSTVRPGICEPTGGIQ